MLGIVFVILSCVYSAMIIVTALMKSTYNICKYLFVIGSVLLLISTIGIVTINIKYIIAALSGIILINLAAVINGYKLFGKPHWKHHILRGIYSAIIILLFILYFI